ncbi:MAG: hypothetical protein AB2A00_38710 [Myxococcota bacterium]
MVSRQAERPGELPALPHDVTLAVEDPTFMVATWRNVFFSMWCSAPTVAQLETVIRIQRPMWTQHPKNVVAFSYIAKMGFSQLNISSEVRKAIDESARLTDPHARASVHLIAGQGFFLSLVRSLIAGIHILQKAPFPLKVTDSEADAVAFLVPHVGADVGPVARAVIARYRARMGG